MKTPHAILIGLALITAALFFRQPSVAPAQAGLIEGVDGFECAGSANTGGLVECAVLHGDKISYVHIKRAKFIRNDRGTGHTIKWR